MSNFICEYCQRNFACLRNLRIHSGRCHCKSNIDRIRILEEDLRTIRDRCTLLEYQLETSNERLKIEQERYQTLQNHLVEIAKQPTVANHTTTMTAHQNQRTVNIINQLGAYDFEEKRMEQILIENFTQDVFLGGPDKIAEFAAQHLLTDPETQKPRVVCTDISRKTYRYIDPLTRELQVDPGFQKTHRMLKRPLEQANLRVFYDEFLRNDPDDLYRDQWKKNDEFIEDPTRFPDKLHQYLRK